MTNNVSFLRHSAWVGPGDFSLPIIIIGCGAVGSNIALNLAKLGAQHFILWDVDIVEAHNLPNQAYMPKHIGISKVKALKEILQEFNPDIKVEIHNEFFTENTEESLQGYLVLATDSMSSRKTIFNSLDIDTKFVFEVRLGFDYGETNIFNPLDPDESDNWYEGLGNDEDIPEGPCNQRICTTLVNLICAFTSHEIARAVKATNCNTRYEYSTKNMFELNSSFNYYKLQ